MRYLGGKHRFSRVIASILNQYVEGTIAYIEPFCGACNVALHVSHPVRLLADIHPALITMWKAIQDGWEPPSEVSLDLYTKYKQAQDPTDPLTAFIGFGCSFGGKWFGGYARYDKTGNDASGTAKSLAKKRELLAGARFRCMDFASLEVQGALIYCDPPYKGTTGYAGTPDFDHDQFYTHCAKLVRNRNKVFVSEYTEPTVPFVKVWSADTKTSFSIQRGSINTARKERLFRIL